MAKATIFLFIAVFTQCNGTKHKPPAAQHGALDLRTWDFDKDGPVSLDGEWTLYWQKQVTAKNVAELTDNAGRQFIRVPMPWNNLVRQRYPDTPKPGHGFGTLHLKLLLPERKDLQMFNVWTANSFALYCGDRPIGQSGRFAAEPGMAIPLHAPALVSLDQCGSSDLYWQIANFETYFGGPRHGWRLGSTASLAKELAFRDYVNAGIIALTFFFGLSFSFAWLLMRQARHYLVFAGLSWVAMLLRLSGEKVFQRFFSANLFDFQIRMEYGATAWCGLLVLWGIHLQFPRLIGRWLLVLLSLPAAIVSLLTLLLPVSSLTQTVPFLLTYFIGVLLFSAFFLFVALRRKEKNAEIFLAAVLLLFGIAAYDSLVLQGIVTGPRYSGLGLLTLLFTQSLLTIRTFLRSSYETEVAQSNLTRDLAQQLAVTERQNALLAAAADMWIINDPHNFGRIRDASERACLSLGYTREELLALYVKDIEVEFPVATEEQWLQHLEMIRSVSGPLQLNGLWRRKAGTTFHVSVTVSLHEFQGKEYLLGIGRDMTFALESGLALRRSEEKFEDFYLNNPLTLIILKPNGNIFDTNPAARNHLGYTAQEFLDRPMSDFVFAEDRAMVQRYFAEYLQNPLITAPLEYRQLSKEGRIIWVSQSLQILRGNDAPDTVLVSCRNISKRKEAEKALFESEAQMRLITEAIPGPVSHIGRDGTYVFINKHYEDWFGDKKEDLIGKKPEQVLNPDLFAGVESYFEQVRAGKEVTWETKIKPADGKERFVQIMHIPDFDITGKPAGIFTIVYDISERKHAEDTLRSSLEEKNMLLAEIHHRVKNNLQVISSLISMQGRLISDTAAQRHLESLGMRIRAMGLLHNILYKSIGTGKVDMNVYLTSIAEQVMSVQRHVAEGVPMEIEIQNIHLNIETALPIGLIVNEAISNSIKYAFGQNNNPRLRLSLKREKTGYSLLIADNGPGILPEIRKDSTLGLRLIETLTRQLHGQMNRESMGGVSFFITFSEQKKEEDRWSRLTRKDD